MNLFIVIGNTISKIVQSRVAKKRQKKSFRLVLQLWKRYKKDEQEIFIMKARKSLINSWMMKAIICLTVLLHLLSEVIKFSSAGGDTLEGKTNVV